MTFLPLISVSQAKTLSHFSPLLSKEYFLSAKGSGSAFLGSGFLSSFLSALSFSGCRAATCAGSVSAQRKAAPPQRSARAAARKARPRPSVATVRMGCALPRVAVGDRAHHAVAPAPPGGRPATPYLDR